MRLCGSKSGSEMVGKLKIFMSDNVRPAKMKAKTDDKTLSFIFSLFFAKAKVDSLKMDLTIRCESIGAHRLLINCTIHSRCKLSIQRVAPVKCEPDGYSFIHNVDENYRASELHCQTRQEKANLRSVGDA